MWACAVVFCFLWFYDGYFCFFPIKVGQIKPGKWHQRVPNYFVDKPLKASEEVVHRHNKFLLLNRCCPLFLKRVFILNALCSCWMFHTFIFQLVGDDSCASYLLVIVIVRIDTLKISFTLICNPSCVFVFLQITNIWLIFFSKLVEQMYSGLRGCAGPRRVPPCLEKMLQKCRLGAFPAEKMLIKRPHR